MIEEALCSTHARAGQIGTSAHLQHAECRDGQLPLRARELFAGRACIIIVASDFDAICAARCAPVAIGTSPGIDRSARISS